MIVCFYNSFLALSFFKDLLICHVNLLLSVCIAILFMEHA